MNEKALCKKNFQDLKQQLKHGHKVDLVTISIIT